MSAETIIKSYAETVENLAGKELASDIRKIIDTGAQLGEPEKIGSSLQPVEQLSPFRVRAKRALGFARPTVARFGVGELYSSILSQRTGDDVIVSAFDD